MLKKRAIKTLASIVFESILVTCIPFKLFADSLPQSVSLEASEGVTAEFAIENSWAGYFNGRVTITNNTASPISNWAICFDYADSIENIWDAVIEAIELVGVDGGGCVALTALGAIECGYKVTLIEDAIGTMLVKKKLKYNNKLRALGATFA